MRETISDRNEPTESFRFEEDVDGPTTEIFVGQCGLRSRNAADRSIFDHGWCVAIRGSKAAPSFMGLPTHTFETDEAKSR